VHDACPPDAVGPAGTLCRAATGTCDVEERCDGGSPRCPADVVVLNGMSCDDGLFCDGSDSCRNGTCVHAGDPCAGGPDCARSCNEAAHNCLAAPGTPCASDGNVCTDDRCNGVGACQHLANAGPCDDGNPCTRDDVCLGGACSGTPPICGDGILQASCGEQCDDGNDLAGDTCPADCRLGLDDASAAKAASACEKTLLKAGLAFAQKRLKTVGKCASTILRCVQMLGDADPKQGVCIGKAGAKCGTALTKSAADKQRLETTLAAACGGTLLDDGDLRAEHGLGYDRLGAACASLDTAAGVAACVADPHDCATARLAELEQPRLRQLLTLAGVDPESLPCLDDLGGGGGLGDPKGIGKATVTCAEAIDKGGTDLATRRLKVLGACLQTIFGCAQLHTEKADCVPSAQAKCAKALDGLADARAQLDAPLDKGCASIDFKTALSQPAGADLAAPATECARYGAPARDDYGSFKQCLFQQHLCVAEDLLVFEAPRAEQLLGLIGEPLHSAFCPAP